MIRKRVPIRKLLWDCPLAENIWNWRQDGDDAVGVGKHSPITRELRDLLFDDVFVCGGPEFSLTNIMREAIGEEYA